jgi:arylsulfatase A-like enzyme
VREFVQSHDLMPTTLALLGVPYGSVDGESTWTLVTGERKTLRDHIVTGWAVFCSGNAGARASVRDAEWNYVTTVHEEDAQPELYYLPSDPEERINVHDQHPEVVARQRTRMEAAVGQPIPAQLTEVCDHPVHPPMHQFLQARYGA